MLANRKNVARADISDDESYDVLYCGFYNAEHLSDIVHIIGSLSDGISLQRILFVIEHPPQVLLQSASSENVKKLYDALTQADCKLKIIQA